MKVSRDNYEVFFIDFFDGGLDHAGQEELFSFLSENPDLREEFEQYEVLVPQEEKFFFEHKESLEKGVSEKEINGFNFEQHCIAFLEGDLDASRERGFHDYLSRHPEKAEIFNIYKKSRLQPEESLVFFGKKDLMKKVSLLPRLVRIAAVAASVAILAGAAFFFGPQKELITDSTKVFPVQSSDIQSSLPDIASVVVEKENNTSLAPVRREVHVPFPGIALVEEAGHTNQSISEREVLSPLSSRIPASLSRRRDEVMLALVTAPASGNITRTTHDPLKNILGSIDDLSLALNTDGIDGSGRISIWDIAHAGVNGIGKLTGANIRMNKKTDEEGNLTALAFQSRNLNFTKRIND